MPIVGDRVFPGGGLAGVVQAEVFAQGVVAHGPAEVPVEFGEGGGGCQRSTKQLWMETSILLVWLKQEKGNWPC